MFLAAFWERNPALLYALAALIGSCIALNHQLFLIIPFLLIILPYYQEWKKILLITSLAVFSFLYVHTEYKFPQLPPEGIRGMVRFDISSLSTKRTPYGAQWCYSGTIKNIPCVISIPKNEKINRPPADRAYFINGLLKQSKKGSYYFLPNKNETWKPVKRSWSFAEMRFNAKKAVTKYIQNHISDKKAADFLAGLATGTFEDPLMFAEFSRFGLQHIMAISGFHFAIIASILALFLRFMVRERFSTPVLILLLCSYFFFLGDSPSIIRAWITILVALIGTALERRAFGLNSLGAAILFILIYNPLMSVSIGFQFSALSTAAILLFFPIFDEILRKVFVRRPLSQMVEMSWLDQHGYTILATFRQAFALTLAVNVVAFPAMLFYFQKFPYLSLLYNLFFPFLVSISMLLLIIGLALGPFGGIIHGLNTLYTQFVLNFLYGMPTTFDRILQIKDFSGSILIIYLSAIFLWGIWMQQKMKEEQLERGFI